MGLSKGDYVLGERPWGQWSHPYYTGIEIEVLSVSAHRVKIRLPDGEVRKIAEDSFVGQVITKVEKVEWD